MGLFWWYLFKACFFRFCFLCFSLFFLYFSLFVCLFLRYSFFSLCFFDFLCFSLIFFWFSLMLLVVLWFSLIFFFLQGPGLQTPPTFHEKTPKRGKKERQMWREEGKKREMLGASPFRGTTLRGSTLLGPLGLGPHLPGPKKEHKQTFFFCPKFQFLSPCFFVPFVFFLKKYCPDVVFFVPFVYQKLSRCCFFVPFVIFIFWIFPECFFLSRVCFFVPNAFFILSQLRSFILTLFCFFCPGSLRWPYVPPRTAASRKLHFGLHVSGAEFGDRTFEKVFTGNECVSAKQGDDTTGVVQPTVHGRLQCQGISCWLSWRTWNVAVWRLVRESGIGAWRLLDIGYTTSLDNRFGKNTRALGADMHPTGNRDQSRTRQAQYRVDVLQAERQSLRTKQQGRSTMKSVGSARLEVTLRIKRNTRADLQLVQQERTYRWYQNNTSWTRERVVEQIETAPQILEQRVHVVKTTRNACRNETPSESWRCRAIGRENNKEMILFVFQERIHCFVPHIHKCRWICSCVWRGRVQRRSRRPCGDTKTSSTIQLAQQIMEAPQVQHIGQHDGQCWVRPQTRKRQRTDISDVGLQGVRCSVKDSLAQPFETWTWTDFGTWPRQPSGKQHLQNLQSSAGTMKADTVKVSA